MYKYNQIMLTSFINNVKNNIISNYNSCVSNIPFTVN